MKTVRYIILFVAIALLQMSLSAQNLAEMPSMTTFQSTSTMPMSGSSLATPNTGNKPIILGIDHDEEESEDHPDPGQEQQYDHDIEDDLPIGTLPVTFMVLLLGGYAVLRRRATL